MFNHFQLSSVVKLKAGESGCLPVEIEKNQTNPTNLKNWYWKLSTFFFNQNKYRIPQHHTVFCLTEFYPRSPAAKGYEPFFHISIVEGDISLVLDSEALSRYMKANYHNFGKPFLQSQTNGKFLGFCLFYIADFLKALFTQTPMTRDGKWSVLEMLLLDLVSSREPPYFQCVTFHGCGFAL